MSFTSELQAYEDCMMSTGMIATVNFEDKQLEQCGVKRDIEENLVKSSILSIIIDILKASIFCRM